MLRAAAPPPQVYDAKKGAFAELGMLDVQQIFGRAGRPQFDVSGEATIITAHSKLAHYLGEHVCVRVEGKGSCAALAGLRGRYGAAAQASQATDKAAASYVSLLLLISRFALSSTALIRRDAGQQHCPHVSLLNCQATLTCVPSRPTSACPAGMLTHAVPIESQFKSLLPDNLNAELVLGSVSNVKEAVAWLTYTYLHVRMTKNPLVYGISYEQLLVRLLGLAGQAVGSQAAHGQALVAAGGLEVPASSFCNP